MLDVGIRSLSGLRVAVARSAWHWLQSYGRGIDIVARAAVRDRRLSRLTGFDWSAGQQVLRSVFGHHSNHCFNVRQHAWLSLTETQATGGLAHFLDEGPPDARHARIAMLLTACGADTINPSDIIDARAWAEYAIADGGRLDLVATIRARAGRDHLLIIEAKFSYDLSRHQLRRYETAALTVADDHQLASPSVVLTLLGERRTGEMTRQMRLHPRWRFMRWRDLILSFERSMASDDASSCDTEDFRRFRRTLWEKCG